MKSYQIVLSVAVICLACQLNAENKKYLTQADLKLISEHYPDYKYAAETVGVPILALIAIHHRETCLMTGWYSKTRKRCIENIGGPFMLDLGPLHDGTEFIRQIRAYEKSVYRLYVGKGNVPKVSHNFRFAALVAAYHLKSHNDCTTWDDECLINAIWGYNGKASWCKREECAYLWSDPNNGHKLTVHYKLSNGDIVKFTDTRPGAMVIYKELKEMDYFKITQEVEKPVISKLRTPQP